MKDREKFIICNIAAYAEQAMQFKDGMSFEEFTNDAKTVAACSLNLSQIGELAGRLDDGFMDANNSVPWRKMKGMRNRIVHDYEGLLYNIVWDVLENFLPDLVRDIDMILGNDA